MKRVRFAIQSFTELGADGSSSEVEENLSQSTSPIRWDEPPNAIDNLSPLDTLSSLAISYRNADGEDQTGVAASGSRSTSVSPLPLGQPRGVTITNRGRGIHGPSNALFTTSGSSTFQSGLLLISDSDVHFDETSPIDFGSGVPLPDESVQDMDGLDCEVGHNKTSHTDVGSATPMRNTSGESSAILDFSDSGELEPDDVSPIDFGSAAPLPHLAVQHSAEVELLDGDLASDEASPMRLGSASLLAHLATNASATPVVSDDEMDLDEESPIDFASASRRLPDSPGNEVSSCSSPPSFKVSSASSTEDSPLPWQVPGSPRGVRSQQSGGLSDVSPRTSRSSLLPIGQAILDEPLPEDFYRFIETVNVAKQNTQQGDRFRIMTGEHYFYHYALREQRRIPEYVLPWVRWNELHPFSRLFLHDLLDYPEDYRDSFPFNAIPKGGLRHIQNGVRSLDAQRMSKKYEDNKISLDQTRDHILRLADFKRNYKPTPEFVNAWRDYLGDAAGVPEIRFAGLRSIHPGVRLPTADIPYPIIPRDTNQSDIPPQNSRERVEALSRKMQAMERRLSNLRAITSKLFGGDFMEEYSESVNVATK